MSSGSYRKAKEAYLGEIETCIQSLEMALKYPKDSPQRFQFAFLAFNSITKAKGYFQARATKSFKPIGINTVIIDGLERYIEQFKYAEEHNEICIPKDSWHQATTIKCSKDNIDEAMGTLIDHDFRLRDTLSDDDSQVTNVSILTIRCREYLFTHYHYYFSVILLNKCINTLGKEPSQNNIDEKTKCIKNILNCFIFSHGVVFISEEECTQLRELIKLTYPNDKVLAEKIVNLIFKESYKCKLLLKNNFFYNYHVMKTY